MCRTRELKIAAAGVSPSAPLYETTRTGVWNDARHPLGARPGFISRFLPASLRVAEAMEHARMKPDLPEMPGCLPDPDRIPPHPAEMRLRRAIVDHVELWENCPRRACRRAGACRSRVIACYDEQRPLIVEIMTVLLFEGYRDADDGDILG